METVYNNIQKFAPIQSTPVLEVNPVSSLVITDDQSKVNILGVTNIEDLKSSGNYGKMTSDDISESNTSDMFKNLYGETLLTTLYFSKENIQNIQDIIKFLVHKYTNRVIDNQSPRELLVVMRSMFLTYSRHPKLLTEEMSVEERQSLLKEYTVEVNRLNGLVVDEIVPIIVSQLNSYLNYLRDVNNPVRELPKAINTTIRKSSDQKSVTQVLNGGAF